VDSLSCVSCQSGVNGSNMADYDCKAKEVAEKSMKSALQAHCWRSSETADYGKLSVIRVMESDSIR
jgi:hypothetical protein